MSRRINTTFLNNPARRLVVIACLTAVATVVAATPDLSTPQKAFDVSDKAMEAGDLGALKASAFVAPGGDALLDAVAATGKARTAAARAAAAKFGASAVKSFTALSDAAPPFKTSVVVTGQTAKLIDAGHPDFPPVAEFRKSGLAWQRVLLSPGFKSEAFERRLLAQRAKTLIYDGFAADVASGTFKDPADARAALDVKIDGSNDVVAGDAAGVYDLATSFYYGFGVKEDRPTAFALFKASAEGKDARAMARVGRMCRDGEGTKKDVAEAVKWLRKSADLKDGDGQQELALCYQAGDGVPKDLAKALALLREAVKTNKYALNTLADTYRDGLGVTADDATALKYYTKSADTGSVYAMTEAAACYERGRGVKKDPKAARAWYEKAAQEDDDTAKKWLAAHPAG